MLIRLSVPLYTLTLSVDVACSQEFDVLLLGNHERNRDIITVLRVETGLSPHSMIVVAKMMTQSTPTQTALTD